MKKRALLYFPFNLKNKAYNSVLLKSQSIADAFKENGFETDLVYHGLESIFLNNQEIKNSTLTKLNKIPGFSKLLGYFMPFYLKKVENRDYDVIFYRFKMATPVSINLLKKLKNQFSKSKIILEYPTYPFKSEFSGFFKSYVSLIDPYFRKKNAKYADFVVTYDQNPEILGLPAINICNGYNGLLDEILPNFKERQDDTDEFVITGISGSLSNGFQRVIRGLKNSGNTQISLQIIGHQKAVSEVLELAEREGVQSQVKYLGYKSHEEIRDILSKTNVAIGGLAAYTKDLTHTSSLKNTLYSYFGVPFFYAGIDTRFPESTFPYALNVPNDDTPIDLNEVVTFYDTITAQYPNYKSEMNKYTKENLSWNHQVNKILSTANLK